MLKLNLASHNSIRKILCLGAHSDDIEIGCGGTILKLAEAGVEVHWVVFSADETRKAEALKSADLFLKSVRRKKVVVKNFRESFFPHEGTHIKDFFEQLKQGFTPDVIFTHYRHDLHQDHRTICDLTWNTFRNHLVLEYEVPKYDGDLGIPNLFVHLDQALCDKKVSHILKSFKTQSTKHWFTEDTFRALLRLRGVESCSPEKYAEAFHCRKAVLGVSDTWVGKKK
jgi:LmbE family N-acetylglucosaminyl deacetylase